MLSDYIAKKLRGAEYKLLKDGTYFGEIPGLHGVWANAKNLEDCREELKQVLEEWLCLRSVVQSRSPLLPPLPCH